MGSECRYLHRSLATRKDKQKILPDQSLIQIVLAPCFVSQTHRNCHAATTLQLKVVPARTSPMQQGLLRAQSGAHQKQIFDEI